ncbi:MAG: hypothetical protein ABL955_13120, partial [Elusimicrobiota bacterium]
MKPGTRVFGALTAALAATYFGLGVGLQELLQPFSGGSDLAGVINHQVDPNIVAVADGAVLAVGATDDDGGYALRFDRADPV